jgi:hypothetical protein
MPVLEYTKATVTRSLPPTEASTTASFAPAIISSRVQTAQNKWLLVRKVYALMEIVASFLLTALGAYVFGAGYSRSPRGSMFILPIGASLFVSGSMALAYAIRSRVWLYRMLGERPVETIRPVAGLFR